VISTFVLSAVLRTVPFMMEGVSGFSRGAFGVADAPSEGADSPLSLRARTVTV
jgi:hypothetical protein